MGGGQHARVQQAGGARRGRIARVVLERVALRHGPRVLADEVEVDDLGHEAAAGGGQHEATKATATAAAAPTSSVSGDRRRSARAAAAARRRIIRHAAGSHARPLLDSGALAAQDRIGLAWTARRSAGPRCGRRSGNGRPALLGLVVGSFANVCIHRIPARPVGRAPRRSRCPSLRRRRSGPWDNVPVLSWLSCADAAARCRAPISLRYPLVEAANGLAYWARRRPCRADAAARRGHGARHRAARPEPHRPRPPPPARRHHAPGDRGGPRWPAPCCRRAAHRARRRARSPAAAGGYLAFFAVAAAYRRYAGMEAWGRGTGSWWPCWARSWAGRGCCSPSSWPRCRGALVGARSSSLAAATAATRCPFGTFLGAGRDRGRVRWATPIWRWYTGVRL